MWSSDGGRPEAISPFQLSPTPDAGAGSAAAFLRKLRWAAMAIAVVSALGFGFALSGAWERPYGTLWFLARLGLYVVLAWFYLTAATAHARDVNTFKARGDQSGYLWDAQQVYANRLGREPQKLIGERMRMPLYAGYLAMFYTPRLSDEAFFDVAKVWNIRLSLVLLALFCITVSWHLPPLASTNLTLAVAFGYFVYRAGYAQPELLFYAIFFGLFLACWHLLGTVDPGVSGILGVGAGVFAGLAYLSKAVVPPFIATFLPIFAIQEVVRLRRHPERGGRVRTFAGRMAAAGAVAATFLAVISPYVVHNKRTFGAYFYNVNTSYYIWYDSGAEARALLLPLSDDEGRISLPASELPSLRTYLATHRLSAVLGRIGDGLSDMAVRSYETFGYLKYVLLYAGIAVLLASSRRRAFGDLVRSQWALVALLVAYAAVYVPAMAFFVPTSSTGSTRFLLAHVAPLLFALARLSNREPFRDVRWGTGRRGLGATSLQVGVLCVLALDLSFWFWPRLMTTFSGY
jgi:hypothetical protein